MGTFNLVKFFFLEFQGLAKVFRDICILLTIAWERDIYGRAKNKDLNGYV